MRKKTEWSHLCPRTVESWNMAPAGSAALPRVPRIRNLVAAARRRAAPWGRKPRRRRVTNRSTPSGSHRKMVRHASGLGRHTRRPSWKTSGRGYSLLDWQGRRGKKETTWRCARSSSVYFYARRRLV
jgi:hypothetical protein